MAFERTWAKRCPGVVTSLREGGDELLTFFRFPTAQWKPLRTTNTIERLHEEFRRRVKTQGSLPTDDAAVLLLFSLVASEQIKLRRIDGWRKIAAVVKPAHGGGSMKFARVVLTVGFVLSILAGPLAAEAQPAGKVARLGVLLFSTPAADPNLPAFLRGLRDLGYVEGRNVALEYRYAEGQPERVNELALQIARSSPMSSWFSAETWCRS